MEILVNILAPLAIFVSALLGGQEVAAVSATLPAEGEASVELGITELSPKGEEGGFAMPASGCSSLDPYWHGYPIHDCDTFPDISTDKPIIRLGEDVEVFWDPHTHVNCVLSENLMVLLEGGVAPDPDTAGSRVDTPTGETMYTITCDGTGNVDSTIVKVLPRIQET